jgi:hypothetical protein
MASTLTPDMVEEILSLAASGMSDPAIAQRLRLGRATVVRYRNRNGIPPGCYANTERTPPPEPEPTPMAELVAAARPWAQLPWSAKGGPSWL